MSDILTKVNVSYNGFKTCENGDIELSLIISHDSNWSFKQGLKLIKTVIKDKGNKFTLTIGKYRKKRSIDQNALMWKLLTIMADEQKIDTWDCYIDILSKFGAKFEYLECTKEAFPILKNMFRAIKVVDERTKENGKETVMCKAFIGSSQYDTKEMTVLIDSIFNELADMGIDTDKEVSYEWQEWLSYKERTAR